jgi:tRNA(Ser,Leu) C12 N-acetylase TAN1
MNANLLVTYDPNHAGSAKEEIDLVMKKIKAKPKFLKPVTEGLFEIYLPKSKDAVKKLKALCKKNSDFFVRTFHYTPINKWVKTDVKILQKEIKKYVPKIKVKESWKMDLNKRHFDKIGSRDLIIKLTEAVDRMNVDLENPEKMIKVEIIGSRTGLALVGKDEFLDDYFYFLTF